MAKFGGIRQSNVAGKQPDDFSSCEEGIRSVRSKVVIALIAIRKNPTLIMKIFLTIQTRGAALLNEMLLSLLRRTAGIFSPAPVPVPIRVRANRR